LNLSELTCFSVDVLQRFVVAVRNLRTLHHLRFMMGSTASHWLIDLLMFAWYGGCLRSFEITMNEDSKAHRQLFGTIDTHLSKEMHRQSVLTHLCLKLDKFVSNLPAVFRWLRHLEHLVVLRMYVSNVDLGHICNQTILIEDRKGRSHLKRLVVSYRSTLLTPVALWVMLDGFQKLYWGFASLLRTDANRWHWRTSNGGNIEFGSRQQRTDPFGVVTFGSVSRRLDRVAAL
jgi:hypothetical protein